MTNYETKKSAYLYIIAYYEEQASECVHLNASIDSIQAMYEFNIEYVDVYNQDLLLLEAKHILGLI